VKLYNLGAGERCLDGWVNVDLNGRAEIKANLAVFPWQFPDKEASEILASHILEHFYKKDAWRFLRECHRILKTGGKLHIAVPDMDKFINCQLSGDWTPIGGYYWRDLNHLLGGDGSEKNERQRHKYMYNFETLHYMLHRIGFMAKQREEPLEIDTPQYAPISLYVDAVKIT
jgi:predicted SAM-dependent methyltransferase